MKLFTAKQGASGQAGVSNRRNFLWKLGAGASTALASTASLAATGSGKTDDLAQQLALLEDEKALRKLHQDYVDAMDRGDIDSALSLFADDAEAVFNGGLFRGREQGVNRLYRQHFAPGKTGRRMEQAPGFELAADQQQESLEVSPDRLTATARFPYSIQAGAPLETETSLASMAREQGEGVRTWWEGGVYELGFVREREAGTWKISRLAYNTLSRADYRAGRSMASPLKIPAFSTRFPEDVNGPDQLV